MERKMIYHRGAGEEAISLFVLNRLTQKFDVSEMDPSQKSEAFQMSMNWLNSPSFKVPSKAKAKERILDDVRRSERIADYAQQMTEVTRTRKQRAAENHKREKERLKKEGEERDKRFDELERRLGGEPK